MVIDSWGRQLERNIGIEFGIKLKGTNKIAGTIGFHNHKPKMCSEIDFGIQSKYRNQGIVTEALSILLKFGFEDLELKRIEAQTDPSNIGCIKVLEKTGFKKEGHLRQNFFANGKIFDTLIYSQLKNEFS
jgi:ribosomal-protein-alanine N-acetyltransferase